MTPDALYHTGFKYRNDWRFLKYAFIWRDADIDDQAEIYEKRGVQWSFLDALPDWLPGRDSPPDFMHGAYLGEQRFQMIQTVKLLMTCTR